MTFSIDRIFKQGCAFAVSSVTVGLNTSLDFGKLTSILKLPRPDNNKVVYIKNVRVNVGVLSTSANANQHGAVVGAVFVFVYRKNMLDISGLGGTAIRDALKRLCEDGLITMICYGDVVASISNCNSTDIDCVVSGVSGHTLDRDIDEIYIQDMGVGLIYTPITSTGVSTQTVVSSVVIKYDVPSIPSKVWKLLAMTYNTFVGKIQKRDDN